MRTEKHRLHVVLGLFVLLAGIFIGCADRTEEVDSAPGSNPQADAALAEAERVMEDAGVAISFRDLEGLGSLADLRDILPSPLEISQLEDAQIEGAVASLYEALDALGYPVAPAAPARQPREEVSSSDLAMLHIHLGYMYVLGAVAKLERAKGDMYEIDFPDEADTDDPSVYTFTLTPQGQARIDAVAANPDAEPGEYLQIFSTEQRQAILDSLLLLVSAKVLVSPFPEHGIPNEQRPSVDRSIYRRDALYHFAESLAFAENVVPELEDALLELKDTIADYLAQDMLDQIKEWGFEIENETEVINRIENFG